MKRIAKVTPNYDARSTVPAIVDVTTGAVVNNDYHALTTELALGFKDFVSPDAPDIYPEELRADIDALNVIIYADFNLGGKLGSSRNEPKSITNITMTAFLLA